MRNKYKNKNFMQVLVNHVSTVKIDGIVMPSDADDETRSRVAQKALQDAIETASEAMLKAMLTDIRQKKYRPMVFDTGDLKKLYSFDVYMRGSDVDINLEDGVCNLDLIFIVSAPVNKQDKDNGNGKA